RVDAKRLHLSIVRLALRCSRLAMGCLAALVVAFHAGRGIGVKPSPTPNWPLRLFQPREGSRAIAHRFKITWISRVFRPVRVHFCSSYCSFVLVSARRG